MGGDFAMVTLDDVIAKLEELIENAGQSFVVDLRRAAAVEMVTALKAEKAKRDARSNDRNIA